MERSEGIFGAVILPVTGIDLTQTELFPTFQDGQFGLHLDILQSQNRTIITLLQNIEKFYDTPAPNPGQSNVPNWRNFADGLFGYQYDFLQQQNATICMLLQRVGNKAHRHTLAAQRGYLWGRNLEYIFSLTTQHFLLPLKETIAQFSMACETWKMAMMYNIEDQGTRTILEGFDQVQLQNAFMQVFNRLRFGPMIRGPANQPNVHIGNAPANQPNFNNVNNGNAPVNQPNINIVNAPVNQPKQPNANIVNAPAPDVKPNLLEVVENRKLSGSPGNNVMSSDGCNEAPSGQGLK